MDRNRLLNGVIDIHVHAGPSVASRELDAADMLKEAEAAGYRGFLVKDHYFPSMMGCQMVQRHLGNGSVQVFGSMCLNNAMGLFNLNAVDVAYGMGARMIYFPTVSSKNHIDAHKGHFAGAGKMTVPETPVVYVDEKGELDPAAVRVLEYMAEKDMAFPKAPKWVPCPPPCWRRCCGKCPTTGWFWIPTWGRRATALPWRRCTTSCA